MEYGNGHMAAKLSIALTHSSTRCLFWNNLIHFTLRWGSHQNCTDACFPGCLGPDKSLYAEATPVNGADGVLPRSHQRKWSLWVFTGIFLSNVLGDKTERIESEIWKWTALLMNLFHLRGGSTLTPVSTA